MLRVPTYLAPSPIAGMGLFSSRSLPPGEVIWEFTEGVDWRISPTELELFPEPFKARLRHYVYLEESGFFVLCGDNGKFMNHSDTPNCDDPDGAHTVTRRRIKAGEELTCDYRLFDVEAKLSGLRFGPESIPPIPPQG